MEEQKQSNEKKVYSRKVIEFVTVAKEYCVFMNNTERYTKADFLKVASQMLPLLYLKVSLLPDFEAVLDSEPQEFVDEFEYERVRTAVHRKLTRHDDYLEVFKDDMQRSETPVVAQVSEDMADIYQDLMNFCEQYRIGIDDLMNDALAKVIENFGTYWGQRLCNAQRAIHSTLYGLDDLDDEKPNSEEDTMADDLLNPAEGLGSDDWQYPTLEE